MKTFKIIFLSFSFILNAPFFFADGQELEPVPYVNAGKWGYADDSGVLIIPCVYDQVTRFSEGLAAVKKNEKWGFIDAQGKEIISLQYDYARPFSEGLAAVGINTDVKTGINEGVGEYKKPVFLTEWGFVDKAGKIIVPIKHFSVGPFENGVARIQSGPTIMNLKWGLMNRSGEWIVVPEKYVMVWNFSEGLAPVYEKDDIYGQSFGFVNTQGNLVIPVRNYSRGGEIWREGRFLISRNGKWGFIDSKGEEVIPAEYDQASYFYEGLARVKQNGKVGFIDSNGRIVIPLQYEDAGNFDAGGLAEIKMGAKQAFIDREGKIVIPPQFDWSYDQLCADGIYHEGLRKIVLNGKYGFMDEHGTVVIPPEYSLAWGFSEGLAGVQKDGKWGFIDKDGKVVVSFRYFRIDASFKRGLAEVTVKLPWQQGIHGYINKKGKEFFQRPEEN